MTVLNHLTVLKAGSKGAPTKRFQKDVNVTGSREDRGVHVSVDGVVGPETINAAADLAYLLGAATSTVRTVRAGQITIGVQRLIADPDERSPAQLARAKARKRHITLATRALRAAVTQIGVMETGGNNRGVPLERYIRSNQGSGPEPWCGDFIAWCYRQAGSKNVARAWAAVRLLRGSLGMKVTTNPQPGDIIVYDFDHTGLFEKDLGNGTILAIEGNTGRSGAVSDSSTGGDGVYRKIRHKSLVNYYLKQVA